MSAPTDWTHSIETVLSQNPHLETWPGHFRHRISELGKVRRFWPNRPLKNVLEIGCGNGLAAVYFCPLAGRIVASDLAEVDHQAHSIGLAQARELVQLTKAKNVEVLGCSAEKIPLPDKSFDLVYGIYCLEHIPNRPQALQELRRVLVEKGEVLLTVPGAAWALFTPFEYYAYLARRLMGRAKAKLFPSRSTVPTPGGSAASAPAGAKVNDVSSFRKHYPNFPFPEPHGSYPTWGSEFHHYRKSSWTQLMSSCGYSEISLEPVSFLPSWLSWALPDSLESWLEDFLRQRKCLHRFAQFFCIRAKAAS